MAAAILALVASPSPASEGLYLWHVESAAASLHESPANHDLYVELVFDEAARAIDRIDADSDVEVVASDKDAALLRVPAAATLGGRPEARHSSASFVIDFDEVAVAELAGRFRGSEEVGEVAQTIDTLVRFVDTSIPEKTSLHGFLIASQVAVEAAGDCSEHAVLTAAIARALGFPARVALGVLLVDDGSEIGAYGHAWAEVFDGEAWRIADATRPESDTDVRWVRHLPLASLSNEGMGFGLGMMELIYIQPSELRRVSLGNED